MKSSDILINALSEFEGCKLTAYRAMPSEQYLTIGVGHYGADVKSGETITKLQAMILLRKDLETVENYINGLKITFTQGQFDALVDFIYNLGIGHFEGSTLYKLIKRNKNDKSIYDAFLVWDKSGGVVVRQLLQRRTWEAKRYFS